MRERQRNWLKRVVRRCAFSILLAGVRVSGAKPVPAVLILGHMRCGSSLLLHLLLTHPEIIGCGERNSAYRSVRDFDRLEIDARRQHRALFRQLRYVVDQINHNQFIPNQELLRLPRVRLLCLIREPVASISSIIQLTKTHYEQWPVAKAVDYYVERLTTLARLARAAIPRSQAFFLTYDDLIDNTPAAFERLQSFLKLERGFSERYSVEDFTGIRGDPSARIRTGHIIRGPSPPPLDIPAAEVDRAMEAYHSYKRTVTGLAASQ